MINRLHLHLNMLKFAKYCLKCRTLSVNVVCHCVMQVFSWWMKQPISNDFNHSFSSGRIYSARTIYHVTRPARAISKEPLHYCLYLFPVILLRWTSTSAVLQCTPVFSHHLHITRVETHKLKHHTTLTWLGKSQTLSAKRPKTLNSSLCETIMTPIQ